jgi:hypothetical protein
MNIAFDQAVAQWQGTPPTSSLTFTPGASGEVILVEAFISGTPFTITYAGTTGTYVAGQQNTTAGETVGAGYATLLTGAAGQVATVSAVSPPGFEQGIMALLFSGVASITTGGTANGGIVNPGTGAGACAGPTILVPNNYVLAACCINMAGTTETITSPAGTPLASQGSSINYCAVSYTGVGSNVTPTFTCPNGAAGTYDVRTWLMAPTFVAPSVPPQGPMPRQIYVMP